MTNVLDLIFKKYSGKLERAAPRKNEVNTVGNFTAKSLSVPNKYMIAWKQKIAAPFDVPAPP